MSIISLNKGSVSHFIPEGRDVRSGPNGVLGDLVITGNEISNPNGPVEIADELEIGGTGSPHIESTQSLTIDVTNTLTIIASDIDMEIDGGSY